MTKGPILIDLDLDGDAAKAALDVAAAEAVPDTPLAGRAAMQIARRGSVLSRWFWALFTLLAGSMLSIWLWQTGVNLVTSVPLLGWGFAALCAAFGLVVLLLAMSEARAIWRLRRLGDLRGTIEAAPDLPSLRYALDRVLGLYSGRTDMDWGRARWRERRDEALDHAALTELAEACLMDPLDRAALAEVEQTARRVATVTALVPLGLVDVAMAGVSALRMIRRIGAIYGGRGGTLGALRLARAVVLHLAATGAMAVGDDLLEPVLGATVLAKLSRRFGEGLINGALTVRVGLAAIELCRPLPFSQARKPRTRAVIGRALAGLVTGGADKER